MSRRRKTRLSATVPAQLERVLRRHCRARGVHVHRAVAAAVLAYLREPIARQMVMQRRLHDWSTEREIREGWKLAAKGAPVDARSARGQPADQRSNV